MTPGDTRREVGLVARQALQLGSPRPHHKAWPILGSGENKPSEDWACAFRQGYTAGPTVVFLLPPSLPQGAPNPCCAPAPATVWRVQNSSTRPQPLLSRGATRSRRRATHRVWLGPGSPPPGQPVLLQAPPPPRASPALGRWHSALRRGADTSAPAGTRPPGRLATWPPRRLSGPWPVQGPSLVPGDAAPTPSLSPTQRHGCSSCSRPGWRRDPEGYHPSLT